MKTLITLMALGLISAPTYSAPIVVKVKPRITVITGMQYQYAGVTAEEFVGRTPMHIQYRACQSLYGPESRTCNSVELQNSPSLADWDDETIGWVQPVPLVVDNDIKIANIPGRFHHRDCSQWQGFTNNIGIVYPWNYNECDHPRPFTCCAPIENAGIKEVQ